MTIFPLEKALFDAIARRQRSQKHPFAAQSTCKVIEFVAIRVCFASEKGFKSVFLGAVLV